MAPSNRAYRRKFWQECRAGNPPDLVPASRGHFTIGGHSMMKKNFTVLGIVGALAVAALIGAAPARAQEQTHYTYVSFWAVPRAQWNDFEKAQAQTYSVLERLVTDGTLVEWGSGAALVHAEDGYTHSDWFVSTSQAGITKTLESLQNSSRTQA